MATKTVLGSALLRFSVCCVCMFVCQRVSCWHAAPTLINFKWWGNPIEWLNAFILIIFDTDPSDIKSKWIISLRLRHTLDLCAVCLCGLAQDDENVMELAETLLGAFIRCVCFVLCSVYRLSRILFCLFFFCLHRNFATINIYYYNFTCSCPSCYCWVECNS